MDNVFKLHILTPHRNFFNGSVIDLKTEDMRGPINILPNYMAAVTLLKSSFTQFTGTDGKEYKAFISEGIMKVRHNSVTMLCRAAEWPEEIDIHRAEEAKRRAEERLKKGDGIDILRAESSLLRAILRLKVKRTKHPGV